MIEFWVYIKQLKELDISVAIETIWLQRRKKTSHIFGYIVTGII